MVYYFSRHAKRQMQWRRISEEEVKTVVTSPDNLQETIKGRRNAIKAIGERVLKVAYKLERDRIVVVTVIDKKQ